MPWFAVLIPLLAHVAYAALGVDVSVSISASVASCLVESGYTFAIVHATLCGDSSVDTSSAASIQNLRAANMPHVGVYMYCCWGRSGCPDGSSVMSAHEAYFTSNGVSPDSVWLDVENTGSSGVCPQAGESATQASISDITQAAVVTFGTRVGIYTSSYYWSSMVGSSFNADSSVNLPLWYAHYDNVQAFSDFSAFGPWSAPYAKQYNGDVSVCGVDVDVNYASSWQAGSWAITAPPLPAPPSPTPAGSCTYNGNTGMCVASCPGGTLYPSSAGANGCQQDAADVQCCIAGSGGAATSGQMTTSAAVGASSASASPAAPGNMMPCTVVGAPTGVCTSSCPGGALVGHDQASGCEAFAAAIQCCVQYPCSYNGVAGVCTDTCSSGTSYSSTQGATGCRSFADDVLCCLSSSDQSSSGNQDSQQGASVASITGGPACTYNTHSGACIDTSSCQQQSGTSFSASSGARGCMSLAADVQCCVATGSLFTSELAAAKLPPAPTGISSGAVAGIVVGVLLVLAIVGLVVAYLVFFRNKSRSTAPGAIAYINASYAGAGSYTCDKCGASYTTADDLTLHVADRHEA